MDQSELASLGPDIPPHNLRARTLEAVAEFIREGKAKKIVVLTGAGISTAAGIPDFRSPGTGLYNNLKRLNLPYPEAVFDIDFFRKHPEPFYVLAKELYPGKFYPTISHAFIALLARKQLLSKLFTQNIDCLERRAGVPPALIVEAHGSFATQRCIECRADFDAAAMRTHVEAGEVPRCAARHCRGLVKPDIVFFGEGLPMEFVFSQTHARNADLMLVLGTSLTVYPFAGAAELPPRETPRVLFNREQVGSLGRRPDDVLALGTCDQGVRKLASLLGWDRELDELWRETIGHKEAERQMRSQDTWEEEIEEFDDEIVDKMAEGLGKLDLESEETHTGVDIGAPGSLSYKKLEGGGEKEKETKDGGNAAQVPLNSKPKKIVQNPPSRTEATPTLDTTGRESTEKEKEKEADTSSTTEDRKTTEAAQSTAGTKSISDKNTKPKD
ncbi:uncharacterized protein BROUX77_005252 [Berkeleyomyces rouxiae]|uniref:uncharacterized protein n=1 Tax=Berkeleyomyces rouxiae TaxID=2035830 RepID=UPI003B781F5A